MRTGARKESDHPVRNRGREAGASPIGRSIPLEPTNPADFVMIPPFGCCIGDASDPGALQRYRERKLRMLSFWRDGIERQLAALNGAITTLEQQIQRDRPNPQG